LEQKQLLDTPTTQDDMFIRFSEEENINDIHQQATKQQVHKDYKMVQKL